MASRSPPADRSATPPPVRSRSGGLGVLITGGGGTVANDGSIASAYGTGIYLAAGGSVSNAASASISGAGFGVDLYGGATLTNAGTIRCARHRRGVRRHRRRLLVLVPGCGSSGLVSGSTSAGNTLELASSASEGTLSGLGTQLLNVRPDRARRRRTLVGRRAGRTWTGFHLQRSVQPRSRRRRQLRRHHRRGLSGGDRIALAGTNIAAGTITGTTLTLDLAGGGTQLLTVAPGESGLTFTASSGVLTVACFRAGTRIATSDGETPVEALRPGDRVRCASGAQPIRWIGHRHIDLRRHPRPDAVTPIRIAAHAFHGAPARDLFLSLDHAVFVDTVLIPIKLLINGGLIAPVCLAEVIYYHVELPRHDVLLAEGLAAESWLDTGNRRDFANGGQVVALHPDFAALAWDVEACAPLIVTGPKLVGVREQLRRKARGSAPGPRQGRAFGNRYS